MIFLVLILLVTLATLATIYYRRLIFRLLSLVGVMPHKRASKCAVWVLSAAFGILSFNMFSTAGIYFLHFLVLSLVFELVNAAVKLILKNDSLVWKRVFCSSLIPLVLSGVILGYGYANIRNIVRTSYTVTADKSLLRDYKVLFVSDMHYGTILSKEGLEELVQRLNQEKADLFILGGDITDESTKKEELNELFSSLGEVKTRYGTYLVWGNHDKQTYSENKSYQSHELEKIIKQNGIKILEDEAVLIGGEILLVGRGDIGLARHSGAERATFNEILPKESYGEYIITADHQPIGYDEIKNKTDLVVSGHTHAGQVFPGGYFIKLFKTSDLWYGYKKIGNMDAVVSSGATGWGYPIRTQKHSEYVVIKIKG